MKYLHTMVRVENIDASLDFYCNKLGLKEVRRVENEKGRTFTGIGSDSDIVVASAKAYLNAINRQVQMMNEGSESPGSGAGR